jgi:hypothetical protein
LLACVSRFFFEGGFSALAGGGSGILAGVSGILAIAHFSFPRNSARSAEFRASPFAKGGEQRIRLLGAETIATISRAMP